MFLAEAEERLVGAGAWTGWWSIIGGYELYWLCGYLFFVTVAIVYLLQTREGSIMICYYTSSFFSNLMHDWRPILASGKFYVLLKKMYAISLYWYDVSMAVVGGKSRFYPGDLAIFGIVFFTIAFAFYLVGANDCNVFYDCSNFGRGFCSWGWVSSFLVKSRWFRLWSWELLLTHHCSHCLVKNKGGCLFGVFNYMTVTCRFVLSA